MHDLPFVKLHGCGNDYVFIDGFNSPLPEDAPELARAMSTRHRGVGSDGLIFLLPPEDASHQARMRMWNADGSESAMCGNGLRCLSFLALSRGHVSSKQFTVATPAGLHAVEVLAESGSVTRAEVCVNMGQPRFEPADIPLDYQGLERPPLLHLSLPGIPDCSLVALGMGNPHAVFFVDSLDALQALPLDVYGPQLASHPVFPAGCNIECVADMGLDQGLRLLRQRTWERGSGITQACGSGACAVTVAAFCSARIPQPRARIRLDGGDLSVDWQQTEGVLLRGEAVEVFSGSFPWPR